LIYLVFESILFGWNELKELEMKEKR
jgi:hypothetical protein